MVYYYSGDLLKSSCKVICHQTNCQGAMGSGIAKQIREKFPLAYSILRKRFELGIAKLGEIDFFPCFDKEKSDDVFVVNMYSQDKFYHYGDSNHAVFTNYDAFRECCRKIKFEISVLYGSSTNQCKIGFPSHIGCGLAGGDWNIVKNIIEEEFAGDSWTVEIWEYNG